MEKNSMEWLNDGVGLIALVSAVVVIVLLGVLIALVLILRNKIAVQRLNFLGFYATDTETRERYASCTIGNRSLNEVALTELGIKNGKVSFNLTDLYKKKKNLNEDARIVIEQRSSLNFVLTREELLDLLVDGKDGKVLKKLSLYAVDLTGNLYKGQIKSVRKLLAELKAEHAEHAGHAEAAVAAETPAETAEILPEAPAEVPASAPVEVPAEGPAEGPAEVTAPAEGDVPPAE